MALGHVRAMYRLGTMYLRTTDDARPDFAKARKLFETAVEKGADAPSQFELASLYYYHYDENIAKVVPLLKASAVQGHPPALTMLGDFYRYHPPFTYLAMCSMLFVFLCCCLKWFLLFFVFFCSCSFSLFLLMYLFF